MAFNKIFFHAGVPSHLSGWGELVRNCDAKGIPVGVASVGGGGLGDIVARWDEGSTVGHVPVVRYMPKDNNWHSTWDVPIYGAPIVEHAKTWWEWQKSMFGPEIFKYNDRIILKQGNELDKNWASWLGYFFVEVGRLALNDPDGPFRIAPFGFSGGEPEKEDWETPGMLAFLRFAEKHPENILVCLHEYSFGNTLMEGFPYHVGRFQALFDVCDKYGIKRPDVVIHEFGWRQDWIPSPGIAMEEIAGAAEFYAKYPEVLFVGLWTTQDFIAREIWRKVEPLIPMVEEFTLNAVFPDPEEPEEPEEIVEGIDVSKWQENIDWPAIIANGTAKFAFIRSSRGVYTDVEFETNWANSSPLLRGQYHYLSYGTDAKDQAAYFASVLKPDSDLPPVVDIEDKRLTREDVSAFLDHFFELTDYLPIIYTSLSAWSSIVGDWEDTKFYELWVAHWTDADEPFLPPGWNSYIFWQKDVLSVNEACEKFNHCNGTKLDYDVWNGSLKELQQYSAEWIQERDGQVGEECIETLLDANFTRTFLLYPDPTEVEFTAAQHNYIDDAIETGIPVNGEVRRIGESGWSVFSGMASIALALSNEAESSRLVVMDGHLIGAGLDENWMKENCPALVNYTVFVTVEQPEEPGEPEEPEEPEGPEEPEKEYDLSEYILGDGRRYYLKSAQGHQELLQTQYSVNTNLFYQVKNENWESFKIDDDFVRRDTDISPGGGRYYTQSKDDQPAPWMKRFMNEGESFQVTFLLRWYEMDKCPLKSQHTLTDTRRIVAHHDIWESRFGIELYDVLELEWLNHLGEPLERYFYAKNYGLVGWERVHQDPHTPAWTSISELVHDYNNNVRKKGCFGGY